MQISSYLSSIIRTVAALVSRGEEGIAGVGTAIVLTATVVTGSVVGAAVLDANADGAEAVEGVMQTAVSQVASAIVLRGGVVAVDGNGDGLLSGPADDVTFSIALGPGGVPVDLSPAAMSTSYLDSETQVAGTGYTLRWLVGDGPMLDAGEMVEVVVPLPGGAALESGEVFRVELAAGPGLVVEREVPSLVSKVVYLH